MIDGDARANLCLGEKEHGQFSRADGDALTGPALTLATSIPRAR